MWYIIGLLAGYSLYNVIAGIFILLQVGAVLPFTPVLLYSEYKQRKDGVHPDQIAARIHEETVEAHDEAHKALARIYEYQYFDQEKQDVDENGIPYL